MFTFFRNILIKVKNKLKDRKEVSYTIYGYSETFGGGGTFKEAKEDFINYANLIRSIDNKSTIYFKMDVLIFGKGREYYEIGPDNILKQDICDEW